MTSPELPSTERVYKFIDERTKLPINCSRWTVSKWKQHRSHRPPSIDSQNNGNASVGKIHKSKEANTRYDCEEILYKWLKMWLLFRASDILQNSSRWSTWRSTVCKSPKGRACCRLLSGCWSSWSSWPGTGGWGRPWPICHTLFRPLHRPLTGHSVLHLADHLVIHLLYYIQMRLPHQEDWMDGKGRSKKIKMEI